MKLETAIDIIKTTLNEWPEAINVEEKNIYPNGALQVKVLVNISDNVSEKIERLGSGPIKGLH